jgi:hypothetical protein
MESIHLLPSLGRILPNAWQQSELVLNVSDFNGLFNERQDFILRIFSELGPTDIPFKFLIKLIEE